MNSGGFILLLVLLLAYFTWSIEIGHKWTGNKRDVKRGNRHTLPCEDVPEAVVLFKNFYLREIQSSQTLASLFDFGGLITMQELIAGFRYITTSLNADAGFEDPASLSILAFKYVNSSDEVLTPEIVTQVNSNTIGKFLYQQGILNSENAGTLATAIVNLIKDVTVQIVNKDLARSKIAAAALSFGRLLASQGLFEPNPIRQLAKVCAVEWKKGLQNRNGKVKHPYLKSPATNPLLGTNHKVCKPLKEVREFRLELLHLVRASPVLKNLLSLGIGSEELSRGVFYVYVYLLQKMDVDDAAVLSDFMAKYVVQIKSLTPSLLVSAHASAVGKFLMSQKLLHRENARGMARRYARELEESAVAIVNNIYPRSKVVALSFATVRFLTDSQAFNSVRQWAFFFGNEWWCHANY